MGSWGLRAELASQDQKFASLPSLVPELVTGDLHHFFVQPIVHMPELPAVERARKVIHDNLVGKTITEVETVPYLSFSSWLNSR